MIYIILRAQLGNQLFQLFNGISLALKYNLKYKICVNKNNNTIFGNNITYFDNFLLELKDKIEIYDEKIIENNIYNYNENTFHYSDIIFEIENDIYLNGFFQSYKYFKDYYNDIYNLLNIDSKKNLVKSKYIKYFNKKTIAIHFRIGDYYYLQHFHAILGIDYYFKSLNKMQDLLKTDISDYNILYFCQECDNNIVNKYIMYLKSINNSYNFIKISDDIINYEQMMIISNCDNIIIANSTFSWFGAYFSNSKNIIYPQKWFGPENKSKILSDLFPSNWIQII